MALFSKKNLRKSLLEERTIRYEADSKIHTKWIIDYAESHVFSNGKGTIVLKEGTAEIGNFAFDRCSGLTSISIPDSVTKIGVCAFDGCSGLTSITIPNSVTKIGDRAFKWCSGLADDVRVMIKSINPDAL